MDRLIQAPSASDPNVQQPLPIRSVLFLQDSVKYALQHLATAMVGNSFDLTKVYILYGCVKTVGGGNDSFTQGAVYYFGEIFYVSAASFTTGTDYAYLLISNGSQDPIKMKDGSFDNVHNLRRVVIAANSTPGAGQTAIPNFSAWIFINTDWVDVASGVGFQNSWINSGGTYSEARYKKENNYLVLSGNIKTGTAPSVAFTLLAPFIPNKTCDVVSGDTGSPGYCQIRVFGISSGANAGKVEVNNGGTTTGVSLENIRIPLD